MLGVCYLVMAITGHQYFLLQCSVISNSCLAQAVWSLTFPDKGSNTICDICLIELPIKVHTAREHILYVMCAASLVFII